MKVAARGLSWKAGGRAIVTGVDLDIAPGETLGIVGPNGSGKSTLLRLIAGLLPRAGGEVRLDDAPLSRLTRRQVAQRVALVEQHADTAEALTVLDAVELGRTPWQSALSPRGTEDDAIVDHAMQTLGIAHLARQHWATLSGGERQRAHIARALAQQPRLLLMDEPTNHLDIHHQLSVLRLVLGLPVTVVIALHDLNQAMGCDRLAIMAAGRLVACGPPATVLTGPRLAEIFRVGARHLIDPHDGATIHRFHCLTEQP